MFIKEKNAFTLAEIMIVIVIVGILIGALAISMVGYTARARDSSRITDLLRINQGLLGYFNSQDSYPPTACGYDCATTDADSYISSSQSNWSSLPLASNFSFFPITQAAPGDVGYLESMLRPYIGGYLPRDPLNTGTYPWIHRKSYAYAYGNIGNTSSTRGYDLTSTLENPNNKSTCKLSFARYGYNNMALCNPSDPNGEEVFNASFVGTRHSLLMEVGVREGKYISYALGSQNGECGDANGRLYSGFAAGYAPYFQCQSGTPSNTSFPAQGATVIWTCSATGDGTPSSTCSATRSAGFISPE